MTSLFDQLDARIERDPRFSASGRARQDLGLLLFNARGDLRDLWNAAAAQAGTPGAEALAAAVEALRPVFGDAEART